MVTYQTSIEIRTRGHRDMQDITEAMSKAVAASGIQTGLAHAFNIGSTGALGVIEFEPGLKEDLPALLDKVAPPSRDYGHERTWHDGNGHSHLQATLLGPSVSIPITEGRLRLGTWQQVFHIECDIKSRHRTIVITITGD